MRPVKTALVVLTVLLASPSLAVEVGGPAPDLTLAGRNGEPLSLSALRGQVVYVDFWASWCGPCRKSFPWLDAMQRRYGEAGFTVLAVGLDRNRADADRFLQQVPTTARIAFDPEGTSGSLYALKAMPSGVLVGRDGLVRLDHKGFRESETEALETAIKSALEQRP